MKLYFKTTIIVNIFLMMGLLMADTDTDITPSATGAVTFCASWTNQLDAVSTVGATNTLADVNIDAYDANFLIFTDLLVVSVFDANYAFNISATNTGWSARPANYAGNKSTAGTDSDLLIKVVDITAGTGAALVAAGDYGTDYTAITNSSAVIANGGSNASGVEGAAFNIDAKILMDWVTDIKGTYTVGFTLTVASQ